MKKQKQKSRCNWHDEGEEEELLFSLHIQESWDLGVERFQIVPEEGHVVPPQGLGVLLKDPRSLRSKRTEGWFLGAH